MSVAGEDDVNSSIRDKLRQDNDERRSRETESGGWGALEGHTTKLRFSRFTEEQRSRVRELLSKGLEGMDPKEKNVLSPEDQLALRLLAALDMPAGFDNSGDLRNKNFLQGKRLTALGLVINAMQSEVSYAAVRALLRL